MGANARVPADAVVELGACGASASGAERAASPSMNRTAEAGTRNTVAGRRANRPRCLDSGWRCDVAGTARHGAIHSLAQDSPAERSAAYALPNARSCMNHSETTP